MLKTDPNDGAFACSENGTFDFTTWHGQAGLSKRELFTAMAMQGLLAGGRTGNNWKQSIVADAIKIADLLIEGLNA